MAASRPSERDAVASVRPHAPRGRHTLRAAAVSLLSLAALWGCGAYKDHAERNAEWQREHAAALDGGVDIPAPIGSTGTFQTPPECIRSCAKDPGSVVVSCTKAEDGIEFLETPGTSRLVNDGVRIADFENSSTTFYTYTDGSASPPTLAIMTDPKRCLEDSAPNHVLRIFGGPYEAWGGGIGRSSRDYIGYSGAVGTCDSSGQPFKCESANLDVGITGLTFDASRWDGVSFWARRGPDGQDGFRVTVGDKYTDDDLNIDQLLPAVVGTDPANTPDDGIDTEQRYCKRERRCDCPGNRPCTPYTFGPNDTTVPQLSGTTLSFCYDPKYEAPPAYQLFSRPNASSSTYNTWNYFLCGEDACNAHYAGTPTPTSLPAGSIPNPVEVPSDKFATGQTATDKGVPDPPFFNRACTPYQFQSGVSASYCFNPGQDPVPAEGYDLCGDHWQTPVRLSTDWQLFLVPFSGMVQQGFGNIAPGLHPDQISLIRFTWDGGWVDYYIDDVRLYRVKR